jgi:hypothetical protein
MIKLITLDLISSLLISNMIIQLNVLVFVVVIGYKEANLFRLLICHSLEMIKYIYLFIYLLLKIK